jgi:dTDP-glucose 4,6-dehydratase
LSVTLVTGGAGFIGSNFVRLLIAERPGQRVVNLDKLTYAGHRDTLRDLSGEACHRFVHGDIADAQLVDQLIRDEGITEIVNFAAESHVDRSIEGPSVFIQTNIVGTQVLLEAAREHDIEHFVQISTDEVYGELGPTGLFREDSPLSPSSPYSASKTSADLLALAWNRTFGTPVCITRCSNNYGPFQFPEKLIPVMVTKALADQSLPVYGDGSNIRDWIHVEDHCRAILRVLESGQPGRIYNIGADCERSNLELVKTILEILDKPEELITFVRDRPGHDWRYAIDSSRIRSELGWTPRHDFHTGLEHTITWIQAMLEDWEPLRELHSRA